MDGQNRARDGYDHDGDGFTEIPKLKSQTLGLRGNMRTTPDSRITVEYHGTHEFRRGGDQLALTVVLLSRAPLMPIDCTVWLASA